MKTAIARRTFRRTDTNQIVSIGKQIEGEDAYIDELLKNRMVRNAEVIVSDEIVAPTEVLEEPHVVVKTKRKRKKKQHSAPWP